MASTECVEPKITDEEFYQLISKILHYAESRIERKFLEFNYEVRPYLSDSEPEILKKRFTGLFNNLIRIKASGEIDLVNVKIKENKENWAEKFSHVIQEYEQRDLEIPHKESLVNILPSQVWLESDKKRLGEKIKSLNSESKLFRFSRNEYVEEMLEEGRFRFTPASTYDDTSMVPARKDDEIIRPHWRPGSEVTMTHVKSGQEIEPIGNVEIQNGMSTDYWVCSFSKSFRLRYFSDFEADSCIVIHDIEEFFRRLERTMEYTRKHNRTVPIGDDIVYYDPFSKPPEESPAFWKMDLYAYQDEFRLLSVPMNETEKLEEPFFFEMGSLKDIANMVVLDEKTYD